MKNMLILLLTLLWVVPLIFALSRIINYTYFGITMRCLYFSFVLLGYLITRFLTK